MQIRYTLSQANEALKLVRVIASEMVERRDARRGLARRRGELESADTPEGLRSELAELDARIWEHDDALLRCRRELESLGMKVFRESPLTIHIPGRSLPNVTRRGKVIEPGQDLVFCWQEDEAGVCFGHTEDGDERQRRPLRVAKGA